MGPTSIDTKKDAVAGGIESAATSLHEKADNLPGGESVSNAAHATADAMDTAAEYLRDNDLGDVLSDIRESIKRHPGAALIAAAAVGFALARSLRD